MTRQTLFQLQSAEYLQRAGRGRSSDVDFLMEQLHDAEVLVQFKLIDYALGLVDSAEGAARIHHFLFSGTPTQRNYAALYFKRRGITDVLEEAVQAGCIDAVQAFSK